MVAQKAEMKAVNWVANWVEQLADWMAASMVEHWAAMTAVCWVERSV